MFLLVYVHVSICMYVFLSIYVFMCIMYVGVLHTCTWMHMDDRSIWCVSLLLFTLYFSGRVSTEPGAHQFSKPSWPVQTRVSSFYTSTAGITGACHHTQLSHGCSDLRSSSVLGKHFIPWSHFLRRDAFLCVQRKRCSESVKSGQFGNHALLAHCCLCTMLSRSNSLQEHLITRHPYWLCAQ